MSAASLARPGVGAGPCSHCAHIECIAARQIAREVCRICKEPIGFDQPFYAEPDSHVHKLCVEAELVKKLKSGLAPENIRFLTNQELAEILRIEKTTLRNWVAQGKIPYRKVGGAVRFLLEEVIEWTKPDLPKAVGPKRNGRSRISATQAVALPGKG